VQLPSNVRFAPHRVARVVRRDDLPEGNLTVAAAQHRFC